MANIDDVARFAKVSRSTVSRVILNSDKVKETTRKKVLEAIEALNYKPNALARSLASRKNNTIGIISGYSLNDPFYSVIAQEVCNVCTEYNYGTLIAIQAENETSNERQINMMFGKVDAYVFLGLKSFFRNKIEALIKMNIPVAVVKPGEEVKGAVVVDIDNKKSAMMAIQYLITKGHKKIAYMYGEKENYETQLRIAGYKKVLEDRKLFFSPSFMFDGKFSYSTAYHLAKDVISSGATALFCDSDVMAHGVVKGLMDLKYQVPDDIAVMGFDNIEFKNYESFIHLTTVHQPLHDMGRYIAETLVRQVESQAASDVHWFATNIVERDTV